MNRKTGFALWGPVCIKALLLIIGVVGQIVSLRSSSFMSMAHFMYYTNQSNLLVMAITAVLLVYDLLALKKGGDAPTPPNWLQGLRFMGASCITLTFVVFSLLLSPTMVASGHGEYLFSLGNLCVHNLVPILAILDWCLFGWPYRSTKYSFLLAAILPYCYVAFVMICSVSGVMFGQSRFPYFFFDYDANGWFSLGGGRLGVAYWIALISVGELFLSWLLMKAKNAAAKRHGALTRAGNS